MPLGPKVLCLGFNSFWRAYLLRALVCWAPSAEVEWSHTSAELHERMRVAKPALVILERPLLSPVMSASPNPHESVGGTRVILVTERRDPVTLHWGRQHAHALVWRTENLETDLREALDAATAGRKYFPEKVRVEAERRRGELNLLRAVLSEHQHRILFLLGHGKSNDEIARVMECQPSSVRSQLSRIARLVATAGDRRALREWAWNMGFTPDLMDLTEEEAGEVVSEPAGSYLETAVSGWERGWSLHGL